MSPGGGGTLSRLLYRDGLAEVWVGDCLEPNDVAEVMGERHAALLCLDAPYSEKTHTGHDRGKHTADSMAAFAKRHEGKPTRESRYAQRKSAIGEGRRSIDYPHWTPDEVAACVGIWSPLTTGWFVSLTDNVLAPAWQEAFEGVGRYAFAPLPLVETGSRCRMTGDGPSSWTYWVQVARPRSADFVRWGTLPGAYVVPGERDFNLASSGRDPRRVVGGKPLRGMSQIVCDYSRRGGLVVDPTCGAGTTLVAAKMNGRPCVGMDRDPAHAELAAARLRRCHEQGHLFDRETA